MADKYRAALGPSSAVVHIAILYDAVCHECGWESPGNPFNMHDAADDAADAHRCTIEAARHE